MVVHPRMSIMGGGERVAIHSLSAVIQAGDDVSLLSEDFDTQRVEDFFGCDGLFKKVGRITYPEFRPLLGSGFLLYQRLYYHQRQFRRLLSNKKPFDLILGTQDIGYVPSLRFPMLQYCYFPEYFSHLEETPSSAIWKLYYEPARLFYRNRVRLVGKLLSTSDYTQRFVKKIWKRNSKTLYPPCPVEVYSSVPAQRENLAITVGRVVPSKRMDLFLEIARRLPMYAFVIVGSVGNLRDPYYARLRQTAPSNVSIVLSPLRKVKEILGRAKVYVHCMENEHFGITIVEAMSGGCVPVVHDSGGPAEIVTPSVGFRWKDVDQAAMQVSTLMTDDNVQRELSAAASKRAWLFSDGAFEKSLIGILDEYRG